jgi:hypothetical protein
MLLMSTLLGLKAMAASFQKRRLSATTLSIYAEQLAG